MFQLVSLTLCLLFVRPSCLSFSLAHSFLSALLLSLPPASPRRSLLSLAAGVFSIYFAYVVCFPPTACLYICLLSVTHEGS